MPRPDSVIKHLQSFDPEVSIAYDIWQVADVIDRCKERGLKINEEQAEEVIEGMNSRKDATIGLNWDVMDAHIDFFELEEVLR